jgi:ABC-type transporter Mla MlaB component
LFRRAAVMLKITTTQESASGVRLILEGKIAEQWAALLDGVCRGYLREQRTVQLDCANVDFIDANGVAVLKSLPPNRVMLSRVPNFMAQQLRNEGQP